MKGRAPRRKGKRFEYEVVWSLLNEGIDAKRVPLSGSSWIKGDILIKCPSRSLVGECKRRKTLPFEKWLAGVDLLFMRADRGDTLVLMYFPTFLRMLKAYVLSKSKSSQ